LHVPSQTLAEKSVSTVTSLETGRLKLSEETAYDIYRQSGVAMKWLLDSNPKEKPYTIDEVDGSKLPYTKELFERIQAHLKRGITYTTNPARILPRALSIVGDWISVYTAADNAGNHELAYYLMRNFLDQLVERLGKDDKATAQLNEKARLYDADGSEWRLVHEGDQISFSKVEKQGRPKK
jgi:hypothetical protein